VADDERYESIACNICGGTAVSVVYEARPELASGDDLARTFRSSGDERLVDRVVACNACGLQFVSPRLKPEAILEGYREGADEQFVSQARGRELTFAKCLDVIERVRAGRRGRLLDIGTAGGSFLKVAKDRGWTVDGCEPNRWLCDWANQHYGLTITPGTVFEQNYPAARFDVVTLWDVLEHTPDPRRVIEECRRLLAPGGLLVINYPDIGSWIARVMGRSWVFLLSVHLYYFTRTTIARLLTDCGFEMRLVRPHYQWLAAGYVAKRAQTYVGGLGSAAGGALRTLRLDETQIPYWMGQTLVVAERSQRPSTE
jgi:2-polyprenyl-3-methyl-5-hydroxy-6-metoxy-1,4-benzoquinol methylase